MIPNVCIIILYIFLLLLYQSKFISDIYAMNFHWATGSQFDDVNQPFLWTAKTRQRNTSSAPYTGQRLMTRGYAELKKNL